ncbi:AfsR/SARP family transcriptional regulator [Streptomyces collinus]|uniref:Transcriptional regulator, SARP family protein n=1 Tax=Streptomyces collinus (strain DSM 40733 / Tue 365) TaxID=1214242 RepID=S5VJM3_STRC3|nr:AfsR/SARP family transcriptional regulator [Streptomyces collinus]AGS70787.1 transcriptional regulator, SARP family protein [Streptomyces collinus Tu 365]
MTGSEDQGLRFNVLGSLECLADGHRIKLGGPLQERILTSLLLEPGRTVPIERLIETAWGEAAPDTAKPQVRKAIADLRRRLPGGPALIVTEDAGYRGALEPLQVDLHLFSQHVQKAASDRAAGEPGAAAGELRKALALWRGPVLNGTGGAVLDAASTVVEERRLAAVEELFALRLQLGEDSDLVSEIREFADAYPLREGLRAQLMLALYRAGRQAEALHEYAAVRDLLDEELGISPCPELAGLFEKILRASPELDAPAPARPAPAPRPSDGPRVAEKAPCTLPYDLPDFTGRHLELQTLLDRGQPGEGVRILAVDGMGGVGKTTLIMRAAHRLAAAYPDGQLYLDLRGFTPGEQPLAPEEATRILLRALGTPDNAVPDDAWSRLAMWQAASASRRLLLVLDNAADAGQIRPLLPAASQCLVLVASRRRLLDLDGAHWTSLGTLPPRDSATLLTRTLGEERVAADPEAAKSLATLCGHLPLALRIATARLHNRPRWSLQYFVDRLREEDALLTELRSTERSVATTIQLSYESLGDRHRRAFRLLGVHPGPNFDPHAAAALTDLTPKDAEQMLEDLLDSQLLQQHEAGRYSFHDLIRSFALSLWDDSARHEKDTAVGRLMNYYLRATNEACRILFPGLRQYASAPTGDAPGLPAFRDAQTARRWYDRESRGLQATVRLGQKHDFHRLASYLARNTVLHLHAQGAIWDFRKLAEVAVSAARRAADTQALCLSLANLASAHQILGEFRSATEAAEEGLRVARSHGDTVSEAAFLDLLGWAHIVLGSLSEGYDLLLRGIGLHREFGNIRRESIALCNLSTLHLWQGRNAEAIAAAERAVLLCQEVGEQEHEVAALNDLVIAHLDRGDDASAQRHLDRALTLGEHSAMPRNRAMSLALRALLHQRGGQGGKRDDGGGDGRGDEVMTYVDQALALVGPLGTVTWQCEVENIAGLVHQRGGNHDRALGLHRSAHQRALDIGYRMGMAQGLHGMAKAEQSLGNHEIAREHLRSAEELFAAMNIPRAILGSSDHAPVCCTLGSFCCGTQAQDKGR